MKNNFLAVLVALVLIISLTLFIIASQLKTLSNPNFWIKTINKSQVVADLSKSIDAVAQSEKTDLNSVALTKVIVKSIDPAMFEKEADKAIVAFFKFAKGETKSLDSQIDLAPWKKDLTQKWATIAPPVFRAEYEKLPACKEGEAPNKVTNDQIVIDCKSPTLTADAIEQSAKTADLTPLMQLVPDKYYLSDLVKKNQAGFDKIRMGFNILNLVFWLSLIISLLAVAGLTALGWPNWRVIAAWNGWIFVSVSLPYLLLQLTRGKFIHSAQSFLAASMDANLSQILNSAVGNLTLEIVKATLAASFIVFGLGFVMVISSFFLPKYEPKITPPGFN